MINHKKEVELGSVSFITKLAGFEHTEYIQPNATKVKINYDDVPMFIGMNIKNGRLTDKISWFLPKKISMQLHRSALTKKCLVLPYVGSVGDVAVFNSTDRHHLASNVAKIELIDDAPFSTEYLYYFLKSPFGQKKLLFYIQGGIQKNITMDAIRKTIIPIPENGDRLVQVLTALYTKIELNNRINVELESMTKTLYDYWFVQFDFPDKNGKPYKTSGGKMVWNEQLKREIPEGWEVEALFTAMDVQYGFPFSTSKFTDIVTDKAVVRIRDILQNTISTYTTEVVDEKYQLKQNDLLIGMDGNFHLNFWDKEGAYLNQRSVRIRERDDKVISSLQAFFELKPHIKARENNVSRTTVGHLSDKDLKRLYLISPNPKGNFNPKATFNSFLDKIISNRIQNQKLVELRDWLLPMLMNGQIKVH
jgi:type I restriction enzyme S subunit